MKEQNFHITLTVNAEAHEAIECINNVTQWWTENLEGSSHKLNDEFTVRFGDIHYSRQKLVELVPDKKVVWLVTDSRLNFLKNKEEWTNTKIVFELLPEGGETKIHFTHIGLAPQIECYDACSGAWSQYIRQSLWRLIATGKGQPQKKELAAS